MTLLTNKIKKAIKLDTIFTWNNPLKIPIPDPINWRLNVFKDNTPAYAKAIALILLTITDIRRLFREDNDKYKIKKNVVIITTKIEGSRTLIILFIYKHFKIINDRFKNVYSL